MPGRGDRRRRRSGRRGSPARAGSSAASKCTGSAPRTPMTASRVSNFAKPCRRQVFARVVGVQPLDVDVLVVEIARGQPPAEVGVAADDDRRQPRDRRRPSPGPSRRSIRASIQIDGALEPEVRVGGEQRRAARRPPPHRREGVRGAGEPRPAPPGRAVPRRRRDDRRAPADRRETAVRTPAAP